VDLGDLVPGPTRYSNVKSVSSLLDYFKFDKSDKTAYLNAFQTNTDIYAHFCLDVNKRTVTLLGGGGDGGEKMNTIVDISCGDERNLALTLIGQLDNPGKAAAIFHLVYKHVKKRVNTDDYTINLKSAKTGGKVAISLVEYLDAITSEGKPRDKYLALLHKYLSKFVHIPSCFVLNKAYSK
jgi:hypothetical protein